MTATEMPVAAADPEMDEGDRTSAWSWRVRVARVVLWLVVVTGPVAAGLVAAQVQSLNHQIDSIRLQAAAPAAASTSAVEGYAELAVAEFLHADDPTSNADEAPGDVWPGRITSMGATEIQPGYFAVTVAVPDLAAGVAHYAVGVVSTGDGWAVAAAPSLVPAPSEVSVPELAVGLGGLDDVVGLEDAVSGFLAALLAGQGDIARYTAPALALRAVTPAPFTAVEITAAGSIPWDERTRLVMAEVDGVGAVDAAQALTYSLVMSERDGRWEVAELLDAPPLAQPSSGN